MGVDLLELMVFWMVLWVCRIELRKLALMPCHKCMETCNVQYVAYTTSIWSSVTQNMSLAKHHTVWS